MCLWGGPYVPRSLQFWWFAAIQPEGRCSSFAGRASHKWPCAQCQTRAGHTGLLAVLFVLVVFRPACCVGQCLRLQASGIMLRPSRAAHLLCIWLLSLMVMQAMANITACFAGVDSCPSSFALCRCPITTLSAGLPCVELVGRGLAPCLPRWPTPLLLLLVNMRPPWMRP